MYGCFGGLEDVFWFERGEGLEVAGGRCKCTSEVIAADWLVEGVLFESCVGFATVILDVLWVN